MSEKSKRKRYTKLRVNKVLGKIDPNGSKCYQCNKWFGQIDLYHQGHDEKLDYNRICMKCSCKHNIWIKDKDGKDVNLQYGKRVGKARKRKNRKLGSST